VNTNDRVRRRAPGKDALVSVLCVEGRPEIGRCVRGMIVRALEPIETIVTVATTARDAIAIMRAIQFDLVISAYHEGDADGRRVLDYLRSEHPKDVDRFVFFTGAEEARDVHPKVIDKGVRVEEFASELRRLTRDQIPWPE
jgi:CheY-like chemotaxis protein